MSQFIIDCGSGNTCKNDKRIIERMIREIAEVASYDHDVVIKWQLFNSAPPNVPLFFESFDYAYKLANNLCLETTASVFDVESMRYLMHYQVPFVKIACRPELYNLAKYSTVPVYYSTALSGFELSEGMMLHCIPKYPATVEDYENAFTVEELKQVSDHSVGWELYNKYRPELS